MFSLFTVPAQLMELARNPILRKNHALEHATINVLEGYSGKRGWLSGFAKEDGFYIKGSVEPIMVEKAVREALERLKAGEKSLAIHSSCGTGRAVGSFLSGVVLITLIFVSGAINLWTIILAVLVSAFLGPLVGELAQVLYTTLSDVKDIVIYDIQPDVQYIVGPFGRRMPVYGDSYFIRTGKSYYEII